jgi:nucleotide-binding universal stress UspA family protein
MTEIASILVHADGSAGVAARLALAAALADQFGARAVDVAYAVTPFQAAYPYAAFGVEQALPLLVEAEQIQRARARAEFDRLAAHFAVPVSWTELSGDPVRRFSRRALLADLLIMGQHEPASAQLSGVPADFADSVMLNSRRPALVLPYAPDTSVGRDTVLVAWKPSAEAAAAASAALPFLKQARRVHVALWDEPGSVEEGDGSIEQWFGTHGVAVTMHRTPLAQRDVGDALLSLASDVGAGLLVMGCYGHLRATEWVLGGTSRTVLATMTVPVLMAR